MTVTRRPAQKFTSPHSNTPSDAELDLESATTTDTESVTNEPVQTIEIGQRVKYRFPSFESLKLRKNYGRRKLRRYDNESLLKALIEEDENDTLDNNVIQSQPTPLERLMESSSALALWHSFIALPEEEQDRLLGDCKQGEPKESSNRNLMKHNAIKARKMLKRRNISLTYLITMENDVMEFFDKNFQLPYFRNAKNYFEVFLLQNVIGESGMIVKIDVENYIQPTYKFYNLVETKSFSSDLNEMKEVIRTLSSLKFTM